MTNEGLDCALEAMTNRLDARFMRDPDMTQAHYDALCAHQMRWYETQCDRAPVLRERYSAWVKRHPEPKLA